MRVRSGWRQAAWLVVGGWLTVAINVSAQSAAPWAVPDAPVRVEVRWQEAAADPETGMEIAVPDLGLTKPGADGFQLTDAAGKSLPLYVAWQGEGRETLLLARDLPPGQTQYLYIGGGTRGPGWNPRTSLLLETRRASGTRAEGFTSSSALQTAWNGAAAQSWGAAFVSQIFEGDNPFGEPAFFLSHFSGYLAPTGGDVELCTNSAGASFVLVNDQPFTEWTGEPSMNVLEKELHGKKLPASTAPVKIDYYQVKAGGMMAPNMTLGWRKPGGHLEVVPAAAFLHPGKTTLGPFEAKGGQPLPVPRAQLLSYLGDGGTYLYEVRCSVGAAEVAGAAVEWHFDDGAVLAGADVTRLMAGSPSTQHVVVTASRGTASRSAPLRLGFYGPPPREIEGKRGRERYVQLLTQLDSARLDTAMLAAALPVLFDHAQDAQTTPYADAWLARKPDLKDPLWLPAYIASVRARAKTEPRKAAAEVAANTAARQYYDQALDILELDLLVYQSHDLTSLPRVQQLAFRLSGTDSGKLGEIRLGDLYRLNGDLKHATEHYLAAQPPDPSGGRRLPAEDQANALTVEDLLADGDRQDAIDRLAKWELAHPLAKLTTNFIVLRARTLALFGRWRESMTELDAFAAQNPDSAYAIDVEFQRARALYELGQKDEARKLWRDIFKNYPKSELAHSSQDWADKP